jgi:hypothetical protein
VGNLASILEVVLALLTPRLILIEARTGDGHGARPAWTLQTALGEPQRRLARLPRLRGSGAERSP